MKKTDLCLSSEGAEVILATSSDEKHPAENIIDGNADTFWTTTGMFPQEFIICFHKHVKIEKLIIQSYLVRSLRVEKSAAQEPVGFEQWIEKAMSCTSPDEDLEPMTVPPTSPTGGLELTRTHTSLFYGSMLGRPKGQ
ncbi:intraflagellar transport protein 25 homolog isoform X3 [Cavia porcellus]|uniref:intraflagellar transport protein 25 homolog isoform X3 n=1 Tax=Cavia porcellus TaxID=10141 RepID=UPI002FE2B198